MPDPLLPWVLQALRCPDDGASPLLPDEGGARCPACGRRFPSAGGILKMLPARPSWTAAEAGEIAAEAAQRDLEAAHYDRLPGLRLLSPLEIPATLAPLRIREADRVVEIGCGTGRITRRLAATGSRILACDHSRASLRLLAQALEPEQRTRVQLVEAEAGCVPARDGWGSRALSCQVLEHLPSEGLRRAAVTELARVLEPGGRLGLSAYWHVPLLRALLPREGHHSGRIYFHRFTRTELAELLRPHFRIERLTGGLLYVLLAHGTKRGG